MTHVSTKAVELHLRALAETGTPIPHFLSGLDVREADLRAKNGRIPWDVFSVLCDRLENLVGGPTALEETGARLLEVPSLAGMARLAALIADPQSLYRAGHRWAGRRLFSVLETSFEVLSPTRLRLVTIIPPPFRPSPAFFRITAGSFRTVPRILGMPEAIVATTIDDRRCEFIIEHAPSMTLWARLRHAALALFSARHTFEELRAQNDELHLRLVELTKARREAEEASRLKSQFIANVSHEIRTPMNGVIGMTEILLSGNLSPEDRARAEVIRRSADVLLRVIDDVLDFSKIEAGKLELVPEDHELEPTLAHVRAVLAPDVRRKQLTLELTKSPDVPRWLRLDFTRLQQVLLNLVGNAVKFTSRGSVTVTVSRTTSPSGPALRFTVTDTGVGITPEARARLFTPFMQQDGRLTRKHGGTGLGLVISKHLVELMGGTIGVDSEPGLGTTFWFVIPFEEALGPVLPRGVSDVRSDALAPLDPRAIATPSSLPSPAADPAGEKLPVLVAEDNEVNRMVIVRHLEKLGCAVDVAVNGREAVEAAERKRYAIIFMDLQMPEMDGFQAASIIRMREGQQAHTPIIAVSAHGEPEFVARAVQVGIDAHVAKPIVRAKLAELIALLASPSEPPRPAEPPPPTTSDRG